MATAEQEMPRHVEAAYKDAVDNIIFLKRQQWVATNYALLVYAAIFVISAQYFQRTDFARNLLGIVAIVAFFIHWYMMFLFQSAIEKFRARLYWIYRTHFNGEEQAGLDLPVRPEPFWVQWQVTSGLVLVSFVGLVFTAIYLWSVRCAGLLATTNKLFAPPALGVMDGIDLAREVKMRWPLLPVITRPVRMITPREP